MGAPRPCGNPNIQPSGIVYYLNIQPSGIVYCDISTPMRDPGRLAGLVRGGAGRSWACLLRLDGLAPTAKRGVCAGCTLTARLSQVSGHRRFREAGGAAGAPPAAAAPFTAPLPPPAKRPRTRGGAPAPPEDSDAAHVDGPDGADFGASGSKEKRRREESRGARAHG